MGSNSFCPEAFNRNEDIIIYGAGPYGTMTELALRKKGLSARMFCDKVKQGACMGIPIISPDRLRDYPKAHVLIASASHFEDMKDFLVGIGHHLWYDVGQLLADARLEQHEIPDMGPTVAFMVSHYEKVIGKRDPNRLELLEVSLIVTEKCSLRCQDCGFLMQYYEHQATYPFDAIVQPFDRLLDSVDFIYQLVLVGGEPFMNKELDRIINRYARNDKIERIIVVTNGTIVPDRTTLEALEAPKVKVFISDYGRLSAELPALERLCSERGIAYFVASNQVWQRYEHPRRFGRNAEALRENFRSCPFRDCHAMLKDRFFRCSPSAHGFNLEIMENFSSDYVYFGPDMADRDTTRRALQHLLYDIDYLGACDYCKRDTAGLSAIPLAIQIDAPIPYVRHGGVKESGEGCKHESLG